MYRSISTFQTSSKPAWHLLPTYVWPYNLKIKYLNPEFCSEGHQIRYTSKRLRDLNISSNQLFNWNNAIDLIDLYHLYIIHNLQQFENETICKCSTTFADRCQYHSGYLPFGFRTYFQPNFGDNSLTVKYDEVKSHLTCHLGLPGCISVFLCLDWRQLCDGVMDCVNGEDAERCSEMEMNECNDETEFRCKDGRCIPEEFAFDRIFDCLDHSDEHEVIGIDSFYDCIIRSSIECEEQNRVWHQFSCGNGEIVRCPLKTCQSGRAWLVFHHLFSNEPMFGLDKNCFYYMICKMASQYGVEQFTDVASFFL